MGPAEAYLIHKVLSESVNDSESESESNSESDSKSMSGWTSVSRMAD